MRVTKVLGVAALLSAVMGGGAGIASAAAPTPFYAIDHQRITTPKGVQPWLPTYTPDGKAIVFQSQLDGTTWTVPAAGGAAATCITCGFTDRPQIDGGFTYAFPDGKRLFVSHELGGDQGVDVGPKADAWILECTPSVASCLSHRYLPVDMSADKGSKYIVQRRTWHLAPDGVHLGWSEIRLDGSIMVVARLERQVDRYVAVDQKVVNPVGLQGPGDRDVQHWENASQLYELKSFVDGGRAILALAERANNVDVLKIDLRTGRTTRQTANPDWDEDGALSGDGALEVLYSWRTRHRLDALAWLPQLRAFTGMGVAAAVAPFYVSSWPGFQCDLAPWLLPGSGDDGGRLIGQPLNTYGNGLTPGNNLSGQQFWSPDSTSVLLQERTTTRPPAGVNEHVAQKGLAPEEVLVARLRRAPGKALRVVSSSVGAWAPSPVQYSETTDSGRSVTLKGARGGTVDLVYKGSLADGTWSMTYKKYTEDGKTFVDGTMSSSRNLQGIWHIDADVEVSGRHKGSLKSALVIGGTDAAGLPLKSGTVRAVYDGRTAPPLPRLAACPTALPRKSPVSVAVHGRRLTVTATIAGDHRPVAGAVVIAGGRKVKTDRHGHAVVGARHGTVKVDAGDTFLAGRATLR